MKKGRAKQKDPLRKELETLADCGIELVLDGQPGTPKKISKACKIAEDGDYMRDYICNREGEVCQLNFNYIKK